MCAAPCGTPAYQGDGFCDDNNNNCGCDWDGGDCCGVSGKGKQYNFCTDCDCLDPEANTNSTCGGACGSPNFVGDGFCDDNNNNCGCDWDNGDCCGKSGKAKQFDYCTDCECIDPELQEGCFGECSSPNFVGDGFCDDGNNNCGCDWDNGDCCGSSGKGKQYEYCTSCACRDPDEATTTVAASCSGTCGSAAYVGDGFCDDNNNNCGCDWDEGDCCGSSGKGKQYDYCSSCACLDPAMACAGTCGSANLVGDGFCDDGNNNCGCDWDNGDCCGTSGKPKQFNYCTNCACLDENDPDFAAPTTALVQ